MCQLPVASISLNIMNNTKTCVIKTIQLNSPLKNRERYQAGLTLAKASGTVTRDWGKIGQKLTSTKRSQKQLRDTFRSQFPSRFLSREIGRSPRVVTRMDTPKSDCHLRSTYMIGVL